MSASTHKLGWIGIGRMGYPMAELLIKAGHDVTIWNRTRSKAEPLAGASSRIVAAPKDLAAVDVLFTMVATGKDVEEVLFGTGGVAPGGKGKLPGIIVECSSISVEESAALRARIEAAGSRFLAAPVSGNGKTIKAGKLSSVVSGPKSAYDIVKPYIETFARRGVSYVGEGELSRICKIAHNVMLGVVIANLAEITILANKYGVPRHAFLEFMNNSVMGSIFTRYKSNAFVNLDFTTTFTPELLRKDLDLGLDAGSELDVPMPVTAAARELVQMHFGAARTKPDPQAYLAGDFAALIETLALLSGMTLTPENVATPTGLETEA